MTAPQVTFIPPIPNGAQIQARIEAALGEDVVESPATSPSAPASGSIPGVGLMPTSGHLYLPFPSAGPQVLTQYIFSR